VRIDRIQIDGFGRLREFDTGPTALEPLVVVLGPNEAGKSTLFTFLTTALYGFQPAARELNPHVPWGADEAAGRIRVRLDGGGCGEVERRLRSQPTGRLTVDGSSIEIRNQPLPWVEHVPRTVFRQVFAVTLRELAGLDAETWARIQDKVVGSMGASDLRSARSVADALEREAGEIWRPNRRGNQRLRDLQAEIRELRGKRTAAYERDVRIRTLTEERERTRLHLQEAREQRQRHRLVLERAQSLVPLRKGLDRIAALRAEGGDRSALRNLPPDPPTRFAELEAERRKLLAQRSSLAAELAEREATVAAFDDHARRLLARREEIVALVARVGGVGQNRARAAELDAEVGSLEAELAVQATHTSARRAEPSAPRARPAGSRVALAPLFAFILGGGLLAWGLVSERTSLAILGAGLAGVGLALWLSARRTSPTAGAPDMVSREEARELARRQALVRDRDQRRVALAAARARIAEVEKGASAAAEAFGVEAGQSAEALAHALDHDLRRAERLEEAAAAAERDARRLSRERDAAATSLEALEPALAALRGAGERLGNGDAVAGLERALARLAAHRRADEVEQELERTYPNLRELEAQLAAAASASPWALDDEQLVVVRTRLDDLEEEIEQLVKRSEALSVEVSRLREQETVDAVDGEVASLRETEAGLMRERDQKWVLAKLLREADRRFREEHQPDLLRRASTYLAHLTGGRYDRLVVDETVDAHLFQVVGPGLPAPVALAAPVSTGTLEQAYLSLRLAIVDHLDRGGERLPLFVDEVFVNWDSDRRARGLEVIAGLSALRQIFVFTCHPSVADELRARGGRLVTLGAGG
jgi:uncharacterized protein YhaN